MNQPRENKTVSINEGFKCNKVSREIRTPKDLAKVYERIYVKTIHSTHLQFNRIFSSVVQVIYHFVLNRFYTSSILVDINKSLNSRGPDSLTLNLGS